jgi:peptidoglycan-N-acetylglucosamine deacetylase
VNPWLTGAPSLIAAAAGVTAYGAVHPRAQLFGKTICRTNSARKLAITFDDGPNPAITPKLLDLLDRFNAKATFFLVGNFVRECPELTKETAARGHAIGNHTELHPNLFWRKLMQVRVELRLCHDAITGAVGVPPKWFRPPFGVRNPWVIPAARELGYRTVMWTLIPGDWREKPVEWLIRRMQPITSRAQRGSSRMGKESPGCHSERSEESAFPPHTQNSQPGTTGDILCLHDGWHRRLNGDRTRTLAALEYWLPRWRDLGLEFVTIDEAVR